MDDEKLVELMTRLVETTARSVGEGIAKALQPMTVIQPPFSEPHTDVTLPPWERDPFLGLDQEMPGWLKDISPTTMPENIGHNDEPTT